MTDKELTSIEQAADDYSFSGRNIKQLVAEVRKLQSELNKAMEYLWDEGYDVDEDTFIRHDER